MALNIGTADRSHVTAGIAIAGVLLFVTVAYLRMHMRAPSAAVDAVNATELTLSTEKKNTVLQNLAATTSQDVRTTAEKVQMLQALSGSDQDPQIKTSAGAAGESLPYEQEKMDVLRSLNQ